MALFKPFQTYCPGFRNFRIERLAIEWIDPHTILDLPRKGFGLDVLGTWDIGRDEIRAMTPEAREGLETRQGSRAFFKARLMDGWPDGAKLINECLDAIQIATSDTVIADYGRRRLEGGHVSGFDPFVPGMMQGSGDVWRQWGRRKYKPAVQIIQQHGGAASQDAFTMKWNGALALALSEQLTGRGILNEIIVCSPTIIDDIQSGYGLLCPNIVAKRVDEPIRADLLASLMVWPAIERYGFVPMERAYRMPGNTQAAYDINNSLRVGELNSCVAGVAQMWPEIASAMIMPFVYTEAAAINAAKRFSDQLEIGDTRFENFNSGIE